ncbi:tetratricopeptide repeat protein [Mycolicibacterium brisbanense]|uniref:Tetratricopeptide TPR_2 repeat protein n=1 Tax=Mycolicibacterium brisbanense TaxID=146020 RepID=A0A100VYB2_9MYCO|nr:tetratricopeptide repeat protein [Mycolicibacterium brisbanense]MCV7161071.1 tetratricopeptide repeat protein [Mycolicibacterium brisbanense]GAS88254.1 tetratricopeptide TPR_2 repeat protein [Mycolicibacterium brisbanense]
MTESGPVGLAVARHDAALAALASGRLDRARSLGASAVDTAIAAFGPDSPDVANVILTCADIEEAAGDFVAAQALAERAAAIAQPLAHTCDPALMSLWVDIEVACARILLTLGSFELANARLATALSISRRILGADDPAVLSIHNMRGVTAKYRGHFDAAATHYEHVRAVLDIEPVVDKQALAVLLHNLGGLAHARGRVVEGLVHARRGLELRIAAVGSDHPDVACDLTAIGALHHDSGDPTAAVSCYRRALRIFEKSLGAEHYEVGMTCANLAVSTAATDPVEARRLYERALRILRSALGAGHPDVALVQHNLAVLLAGEGDVDAAQDLLDQAELALATGVASEHPRRLELQATLKELALQRNKQ